MNFFDPLSPSKDEEDYFSSFRTHLWLAFREFDANHYETYVFSIVIFGCIIWAICSILQYLWNCGDTKTKELNKALVLMKDDLIKAGPFKRDRSGMPEADSVIKLHAVIFKHSQKKIIETELAYQKRRIQYIKDKDMTAYRSLVRKADKEYRQIEDYVTRRALAIMNLDETLFKFAFTRALQQPSMLSKIRGSDESFRRRMWKRIESEESKELLKKMSEDDKKKVFIELLTLQHDCDLVCLGFDSWDSGR